VADNNGSGLWNSADHPNHGSDVPPEDTYCTFSTQIFRTFPVSLESRSIRWTMGFAPEIAGVKIGRWKR
jgi:hypothetical protein